MPDPITALVGAGVGMLGGIGSIFSTRRANKELEKLIGQNPSYEANPIANERMALAKNLLNARMPGAAAMEQGIYGSQANAMSAVQRNATDGSQALALAAGLQGQANQSFSNLQMQEAQDYQRRYGNVVNAQEGVINEGDKEFQDKVRKFQDLAQIRGAQAANRQAIWKTISNLGGGIGALGASGGMGGGFQGFGQMFQGGTVPRGTSGNFLGMMPQGGAVGMAGFDPAMASMLGGAI